MKSLKPLISVIVTTRNEERHLDNCLASIRSQTYPKEKIEIIVVDNNSTDRTKEIAAKYTKKVYNFGPERSAQRNFGIMEKSQGKYVMYLDADMILSSRVIERAVAKMEKEKIAALYVPEVILGVSFWAKVRRFERSFYDGTVIDCVRIVRKDVFEKSGGFDLKLTGPEDWDLDKKIRRLGRVNVLDKYDFAKINEKLKEINFQENDWLEKLVEMTSVGLIFHNDLVFDLRKYLQKKIYYGRSFEIYKKKWGRNNSDLRKQFGFWYRYFGVFWENGKWKNIFKFPELFFGVFFLRFLVGFNYLFSKKHGQT